MRKKRIREPTYTQSALSEALDAVKSGSSIRKAAVDYGIPLSTLHGRIKGSTSSREAQQHTQRLSPTQEASLVDWIMIQDKLGLNLTHGQIRDFVQRILATAGDIKPLGKHWMENFFDRYPSVKTMRGKRSENSRMKGATAKTIKRFFERLDHPAIRDILPEHRYNMDETGIMEGFGINGLVVGPAEKSAAFVRSPQTRTWTSIIECISATGKALTPAIIFKGKQLDQSIFPENRPELKTWHFATSKRGWTSNTLALEWLQKVFLPQMAVPGQRRLLIFDGHGSHTSRDFMYQCYLHDVYLLYLPPHSSHITQPLDLSVFSALKAAYRRFLGNLALLCDASPIGKKGFLRCYCQARIEAFTERNIKSGWRATGLWPININKPLRNPLLLKESTTEANTASEHPTGITIQQEGGIFTPERSQHIQQQFQKQGGRSIRSRLLIRKIEKSLDSKNVIITQQAHKIMALELEVENLQPKKRRKVAQDPNNCFIQIWEGGGDLAEIVADLEAEDDSEASEDVVEERSCIHVKL